jgi:Sulfotransferase family
MTYQISATILALEQQFDLRLARPRVIADDSLSMSLAAARWSAAVWAAAEAVGPSVLDSAEVARSLGVAHRPVFVFGPHRSGTTLVRDLLDSHPALAVLPSEGAFFTSMERRLRRLPPELWLSHLGCEWLRRLANPINQDPYWLLGRSTHESSPYVQFAHTLQAWWPLARQELASSSWPLVAVALAYAHSTRLSEKSVGRRWVEKTPANELFLRQLRTEFPQAQFIHVVRHPYAVYASHKQAARNGGERFRNAGRILRHLRLSYRIAAEQSSCRASDQYLLVRYEDVIENRKDTIDRLAAFLGIERLPILMQPTAAGLPTTSNSSFAANGERGRVDDAVHQKWIDLLSRSECQYLTAAAGEDAIALGYDLAPVPFWRARLLRAAIPLVSRMT